MGTADSLYVYLIINRSTKYEYVLQITLALFKLAWHDSGIFRMVALLKRLIQREPVRTSYDPSSMSLISEDEEGNASLPLLTSLLQDTNLENMAQARVSRDIGNSVDCVNILGGREDGVSYTPAFTYSYQCSSAFLTDYVPVFVFMFLWSSVAIPLIVLCMVKIHEMYESRSDMWYGAMLCKAVRLFLPVGCVARRVADVGVLSHKNKKSYHPSQATAYTSSQLHNSSFVCVWKFISSASSDRNIRSNQHHGLGRVFNEEDVRAV
eukprot:gene10024-10895_t